MGTTTTVVAKQFHVVTYLVPKGGEAEAVAEGTLAQAQKGVEGAMTKAVLASVKDYQADGSAACDGDTKLYAHAEERVVARATGRDQIDVTWRKFRPLVSSGAAVPGKPFEAQDGDIGVRVEVREVLADEKGEVRTATTISPLGIRALQAELADGTKRAAVRTALRQIAADTTLQLQNAHAVLEKSVDELTGAIPAGQLKATAKKAFTAFDAQASRFIERAQALIHSASPSAHDQQALAEQATVTLADVAQGPLSGLAARLEFARGHLHDAVATHKRFTARVDRALQEIPKGGKGAHAAATKALAALKTFIDKDVPRAWMGGDGAEAVLTETLVALTKAVAEKAGALEKLMPIASNEDAARARYGFVCEGRVLVRAIAGTDRAIAGWEVWFENQGDKPFLGTVTFEQSGKNNGFGFESMSCMPGGAAMQPVRADQDYGVSPVVGAVMRLGVRDYATLRMPLPGLGEVVDVPIRHFVVEGSGDAAYFDGPGYVKPKAEEKREKVACYTKGKPLFDDALWEPHAKYQPRYPF